VIYSLRPDITERRGFGGHKGLVGKPVTALKGYYEDGDSAGSDLAALN